jgi:2-aminoethylphosphonate-pyruvate transaminase
VRLSPGVRRALADGDACHREPAFAALTQEILDGLTGIYEGTDRYDAVLLASSGTGAVEAMLACLAPADSRTLVLSNGVYGERMADMLTAHGRPCEHVAGDWLAPLDLGALEARLRADTSITHVATVHHETTSGRLNDVGAVGRLCRSHGRRLLLDAVSSFGAEEIHFADWALEGLAATANKCLHAPPGASFVIAERAALQGPSAPPGTVYLDLRRYHRQQQAEGYSPFTPAVNAVAALAVALRELADAGGWRGRRAAYRERAARVAATLGQLGVGELLESGAAASGLRAYRLPPGWDYGRLHDGLAARGIVIYGGQGPLASRAFRIACMGEIGAADLDRLDDALRQLLAPAGAGA